MSTVTAQRKSAPIEVSVNGNSWVLTEDEARLLRRKIGMALDVRSEELIERLKGICCRQFNVSMTGLMSRCQVRHVVHARHAVMWLAYKAGHAMGTIGEALNRDRTAVVHGVAAINDYIATNAEWKKMMTHLTERCESELCVQFPLPFQPKG